EAFRALHGLQDGEAELREASHEELAVDGAVVDDERLADVAHARSSRAIQALNAASTLCHSARAAFTVSDALASSVPDRTVISSVRESSDKRIAPTARLLALRVLGGLLWA